MKTAEWLRWFQLIQKYGWSGIVIIVILVCSTFPVLFDHDTGNNGLPIFRIQKRLGIINQHGRVIVQWRDYKGGFLRESRGLRFIAICGLMKRGNKMPETPISVVKVEQFFINFQLRTPIHHEHMNEMWKLEGSNHLHISNGLESACWTLATQQESDSIVLQSSIECLWLFTHDVQKLIETAQPFVQQYPTALLSVLSTARSTQATQV